MIVSDIIWQTDGEAVNLPTEVEIDDDMSNDAIADYLSDTYGFLVDSFSVPFMETYANYVYEDLN